MQGAMDRLKVSPCILIMEDLPGIATGNLTTDIFTFKEESTQLRYFTAKPA